MADTEEGVPLEGGVASDVRLINTPDGPLVVKRALPRLKVAAEWLSDPARSVVEVAAIDAFGSVGGKDTVPEIVWVNPSEHSFAMRMIEPRLRNWKTELMAGNVDLLTAERVGEILGLFHTGSVDRADLALEFGDLRFFRELRIDPFFEHVAIAKPELADRIRAIAAAMLERRQALVHGDYSPKNILADGADVVVLDFEVTHWGDPRFDVAFCIAHLMLKATLSGGHPAAMAEAATCFLESYRRHGLRIFDAGLAHVTGCLLLARLFGKSPADYLARIDRERVEQRAIHLLELDAAPQISDFTFPELTS